MECDTLQSAGAGEVVPTSGRIEQGSWNRWHSNSIFGVVGFHGNLGAIVLYI